MEKESISPSNDTQNKEKQSLKSNNLTNIRFLTNITTDSFCSKRIDNTFITFISRDNILFLIYSTRHSSIICYNLNEFQKVTEVKSLGINLYITAFKHCFYNNKDIIMAILDRNTLELWDFDSWSLIRIIFNINEYGILNSACFLNHEQNLYVLTSGANIGEPIKIYDLDGDLINTVENSEFITFIIEYFYDIKNKKYYIITGNYGFSMSYLFDINDTKKYKKYFDNNYNNNYYRYSTIVNYFKDVLKLIESCFDGKIRIWDFHSGNLIDEIDVHNEGIVGICLWDENYLLVGSTDNSIKIVDLNKKIIIKNLTEHGKCVCGIKKINHKKYGDCFISQGMVMDGIKLWVNEMK